MIIEIAIAGVIIGCGGVGCISVQKYINDSIANAVNAIKIVPAQASVSVPSISPEEATELRNQIKLIDLKIEGQIKPQIEHHHAAILAVDKNMQQLIDAVK